MQAIVINYCGLADVSFSWGYLVSVRTAQQRVHNQLAGMVELIRPLAAQLNTITNSLALECFRNLYTLQLSGKYVSIKLLINIQAISLRQA